jgi:L-aspartate oxidase
MPHAPISQRLFTEVCVVGAGAAGLYAALRAAAEGARVIVVSRTPVERSSSYWAQGGIAAALSQTDSPDQHAADTLLAGRDLCRTSAVEVLCHDAPDQVEALCRLGIAFDREGSHISLGLEGGHSARRVAHSGGSQTGRTVIARLWEVARSSERIRLIDQAQVESLWIEDGQCCGVVASGHGQTLLVAAGATILATGGAAALFERTTNPSTSTGSGLLLAHQAGAILADLELVQFHPTCLSKAGPYDGFLITEAIRGEGAILVNEDGERFCDELAGRDEVANAIEIQRQSGSAVYLDMRAIELSKFSNVVEVLAQANIDPYTQPAPVAAAAHYTIGGIAVDTFGHCSIPRLYAVGECSATGVHGANRLASNSLAECFVFGQRAALSACDEKPLSSRRWPTQTQAPKDQAGDARAALWRWAGLQRDKDGLTQLSKHPFVLARLIGKCALRRNESRGVHRRLDCPRPDPSLDKRHTIVSEGNEPTFEHWA